MFEIDKQAFGAFISALRKEHGLTQKELAKKLYLSDKAVSKWETGQSLPDITLLAPLAELLGVTVTELLECRRLEQEGTMNAEQVEGLVQKTIQFSETEMQRVRPRGRRLAVYVLCVVLAAAELGLAWYLQVPLTEPLLTAVGFGIGIGAYFWLFVQNRLPDYYDRNRIGSWNDGPVRMNVPGVSFNNHNWPHIVRIFRVWSALMCAGYPLLHLACSRLLPHIWPVVEKWAVLAALLGGVFLPVVVSSKKHQ